MTGKRGPERVQAGRAEPGQGEGSGSGAEAAPARRYGVWSGNPEGSPEDPARCRKEVYPATGFPIPHQCRRPRGHGPDGAFCSSHYKSTENIKGFRPEPPRRK